MKTTTLVQLAASLTVLAPMAAAQDEVEDPPTRVDAVAEKALGIWEALEYRPVEEGLGDGGFTVRVKMRGRSEREGTATYRWSSTTDKPTSELIWDPASLGQELEREGWSRDRFDASYLPGDQRGQYRGCELVGHRLEGGGVRVEIRGEPASGIAELHFDREGLLHRQVYEVDMGFGTPQRFALHPRYKKVEHGRFVKIGERFEMKAPFGSIESDSKIELQTLEGVHVPRLIVETSTFNGSASGENRFEFTDWKFERKPRKGRKKDL